MRWPATTALPEPRETSLPPVQVDLILWKRFRKQGKPDMKAFLSAVIVALVMGIGAYALLEQSQMGVSEKYSSRSTRL
jgi:hypothetical protein